MATLLQHQIWAECNKHEVKKVFSICYCRGSDIYGHDFASRKQAIDEANLIRANSRNVGLISIHECAIDESGEIIALDLIDEL